MCCPDAGHCTSRAPFSNPICQRSGTTRIVGHDVGSYGANSGPYCATFCRCFPTFLWGLVCVRRPARPQRANAICTRDPCTAKPPPPADVVAFKPIIINQLINYNASLRSSIGTYFVAKKKRVQTSRKRVSINVNEEAVVSGISQTGRDASCCLVLAHGAGAGMEHSFMCAIADGLLERGMATLRYQFPYMEKGSRRPDSPKLCHQTVRAAVTRAHQLMPSLPLIAGGKSFGGRMTSQAQAASPLPDVRGLCFLGFPLHAPKQISATRADHLSSIRISMLYKLEGKIQCTQQSC